MCRASSDSDLAVLVTPVFSSQYARHASYWRRATSSHPRGRASVHSCGWREWWLRAESYSLSHGGAATRTFGRVLSVGGDGSVRPSSPPLTEVRVDSDEVLPRGELPASLGRFVGGGLTNYDLPAACSNRCGSASSSHSPTAGPGNSSEPQNWSKWGGRCAVCSKQVAMMDSVSCGNFFHSRNGWPPCRIVHRISLH